MNFSLKLSALFLFISSIAFSQRGKDLVGNITGTSIVNSYTTLSNDVAANTTNTISVANVSSFSAGDLVLIIQMQGAYPNAGKDSIVFFDLTSAIPRDTSYGSILNYGGAGNNETAQINSVNTGANTITFDCQISKAFKAGGKTQIVRVPRYSSLNIGATGIITCPQWDRTLGYGGIVAIEVQGNTTIASGGRIDASGFGFRGGALRYKPNSGQGSATGTFVWGVTSTRYSEGGYKGESIAGDTVLYATKSSVFGTGSIANGGGGGCANNSGGGGGSNAGLTNKYFGGIGNIDTTTNAGGNNYSQAWALETTTFTGVLPYPLWRANTNAGGGRGGYSRSNDNDNPLTTAPNQGTWAGDNRRQVGGLGGRPLDYTNSQLYLGGGGGSGSGDDSYQGPGGNGGGIVYIMSYGTISGAGQIVSNGANGSNSHTSSPRGSDNNGSLLGRDGGGGGGGGGAIYINSTGSISGITISATGGNGGNAALSTTFSSTNDSYGPGGGGGGGFINITSGNSPTTNVSGGTNGIVTISGANGSTIDTRFPPNGATKGGPGTTLANLTNFSITTTGATICSGNTATITAALNGTLPNPVTIEWYTDSIGGNPFTTGTSYTTPVLTTTTIYWVGTCPGTYREKVTVIVNAAPAAPLATTPINYCLNESATALSATATSGNTIIWYDAASAGNILTQPLTPSTSSVGSTSYFAAQDNGSCTGARTEVVVTVVALPNTPTVTSPVDYCQNETPVAVSATLSGLGNSLLYWGTDATGGTSSGSAPTPSTATVGSTTYYVSESNGTCESARVPIVININAIPATPTTTDTISYCQNQTATALTPSGANYDWYTTATGGVATAAPTPITSTVGVTTYYVSETKNGCESLRDSVKVVVNTSFSAPTASNVNNCIGSTANVLSPNGTGYNWYTASTGGTPSATITPSTVTTGTVSYFVSQGSGTCESPRTQVDVITLALPNAPSVTSPVNYCQNETATALSATASGVGNTLLYWGTDATGGTSNTTATIPTTTATGTTTYYVSENDGTCESTRSSIVVNVNAIPATPTTTDTISYCQNQTATALAPSGANYNWYTTATGGVATAAPTPITSAVGVTTYYVSETQNGCESLRDSVKVVVNTTFTAPTASNASNCFGSTAGVLTPNGTGYNWYTSSTGGTASPTITPLTNTVGTISYFVSQGSGSCESPRTQVDVVTHALPLKPTGTDVTYCLNEPATALTATGTGTLNWYTVSTGGTSSLVAPTPATNAVGNTDYYVSQTDANTCESVRDTITVSIINLQSAPTTANVSYCEDATAAQLTATGTSQLNWWGTAATGGTSSTTAPTPITTNSGTTTYYVSQGTGACESPRASIVVTVTSKPTISFTQNVTTICENACVTFNANSSVTCTNLVWNFGDGNTSSNTSTSNCYASAGTYNVKVVCTNAQGCSDSSTINNAVIVSPAPQAQISVSPGTTVTPSTPINFIADTGLVKPTIVWDFDDVASGLLNASTIYNPTHVYENIGTYCVNLIVGTGLCKDTATTCIEVITEPFIEIPNVFTPNGDNINDLFMVKSSGITTMEANIYDRWGILVYTWNGSTGSWDGKNKSGNMSSNGVYYYIIKATDFKNLTTDYKGHLQLIDSK